MRKEIEGATGFVAIGEVLRRGDVEARWKEMGISRQDTRC